MATILVVEDHAMSRQVLKNLFGYVGHRVLEAADGTAAVALARAQNPDLIVSDIVMPVMDGIEFIRTVRLERGLKSIPVIFYTATYRLAEARRLASEFGMCRVIHKPADPPLILEVVNEMLGLTNNPNLGIEEFRNFSNPSIPESLNSSISSNLEVFQNAGLQLAMLMDLNFHLVGQRDPVRLLETCCSAIRSILNCRYARLALLEENGQTRYFGEDKREEPAEIGATAGLHVETILEQVISERSTFRWSGRSAAGFDGKPESRCADIPFLILPFASRTRVYGWICIADKGDGAPFRDEDEELAVALAAQSSIAYENIIIHDRLQSQAAELRTHQLELRAQNEDLRAAQKELESSRTKYADLYNFAPIGYFSLDTNSIILEVNFAGANLLGMDKQALLNKPFSLFLGEPDKEVFAKHRKTTFTSQNRQTCDLSLLRKDGSVFYVQLKSIAVENARGKAGYIRMAVMDITERKRAEEMLRKAHDELELRVQERTKEIREANAAVKTERQRFFEVLEMLPVYVVLLTPDYHVPFANRFFRERFGESGGKRCYEYLFNRTEPCEICETYSVLRTNGLHHWEWTGPDGRNYDIFDFPFIDTDGSPLIMEVGIDITERKQAEKALQEINQTLEQRVAERTAELQAANASLCDSGRAALNLMEDSVAAHRKAEGANTELRREVTERKRAEEALKASLREKEVLLKEVHHRVKNNLQVISSLMSLQADGQADPALRALLSDMRERVHTMALVHEKLYQTVDLAGVDFAEYARSLASQIWRAHGPVAASMQFKLELERVTLSVAKAVPCGLILNELLTNALKHAFPGNAASEVTVSLRRDSMDRVILSVRDNGAGLPPGVDWRQGRSLGLHLVKMLATQLNGVIEARSAANTGTEFELAFASEDLK